MNQLPPLPTPEEALARLLEGNARFANFKSSFPHESREHRAEIATGQHPFAIIFSCVDSRVPPELVFDQGLGDLFVVRTAGHVIDRAVLGSLEFGVAQLKIPLLVVMGHEKCGAVKATMDALEAHTPAPYDIEYLVEEIQGAIDVAKTLGGDTLDNAVRENTRRVAATLKTSAILSDALASGNLAIVGSYYDLETGLIERIA